MGHQIEGIRKKLDRAVNDWKFHLETGPRESNEVLAKDWLETHSFVPKEEVIGRDDDKMAILKLMFDTKTEEKVGLIPIVGVGVGGLGKTTLAELIFNDKMVQKQFELIIWMSVPKVFDVLSIVNEICRSTDHENASLDQLQSKVWEKINGKRYFLVLDDVWNESCEKWMSLENLLRNDADGSRIIVTTHSKKVADIVISSTMEPYFLGMLDAEKSWDLFKKVALKKG